MYMKQLVVILCVLSLTACANRPNPRWEKPGTKANIAKMDEAKCKYDIGMAKLSEAEKMEMVDNCMIMKGYEWINW